jgi:hypothetical protein
MMTAREEKTCQTCKKEFGIEPEDFVFYGKIKVPPPVRCPACRLIRRLAFRNERSFYRAFCARCKKAIISIYAPESGMTVWCPSCWWSDDWDAAEYAAAFDPSRPFLSQLYELFRKVPVASLHGLFTTVVNSDYTHMVSYLKNCYMVSYADYGENLTYGSFVNNSRDSVDNLMMDQVELCYESVNCIRCYKTFFSVDCEDCRNVWFSRDCVGCSDCFGCVALRKKQYHIFNKPFSKEEYEKEIARLFGGSASRLEECRSRAEEFWQKFPLKFYHGSHNVEVSGDYLENSKKVFDSFLIANAEDCRYAAISQGPLTDAYDFTHYGVSSSLLYDSFQCGNQVSNIRMSWWAVTGCTDIEYGMYVVNCSHIFGSVGLKKRAYCILNTPYSKEEYARVRETIIRQMNEMPWRDKKGREYRYGEFFPIEMSPFGYNETMAQEMFPLSREEVEKQGYNWREREQAAYDVTLRASDLPDRIADVSDAVLKDVISCSHEGRCHDQCSRAFRVIPQELEFYRRMNLPLPRLCPNCRHARRLRWRNPITFWSRRCQCGGGASENGSYENRAAHFHGGNQRPNTFTTSYSPERKEIIYCEDCYLAETA